MLKKLGFIVNPVAGMGGRVGLKGSDGLEILERARQLGAKPESPNRARDALNMVKDLRDNIELVTYPYKMGEEEAKQCGFKPTVIGSIDQDNTTSEDTIRATRDMAKAGVDLILFAGGDGTARNICEAIGNKVPVIGIPAGVKIHSAVYATNPNNAGQLTLMYLTGKLKKVQEAEVMDIDEDAFREGRVTAKLYGYLLVPHEERLVQGLKSGRAEGEGTALNAIAEEVVALMESDWVYIIGPGTTTRAVMDKLGLRNTLLGVDAVLNKELIGSDLSEQKILEIIEGKKAKIVVTVIGGQGYIFGRGNPQISPKVLRNVGKDNIIVIAPQSKLTVLGRRPLLIDTGDNEVNEILSGYYKVIVGIERTVMRKAE
ncbi:ATP-NAD kinase family protein [Paradesulfitobacterium aromaticivorans]